MIAFLAPHIVAVAALLVTSADIRTVHVTGSGFDALNTAIVHSNEDTPTGTIQKSTETVELTGGLNGRVLYHVTTVIDNVHGTLVNTGGPGVFGDYCRLGARDDS